MPLADRVLMGPGPSNPYPEAMLGMAEPVLGHLDPEFTARLDAVNDALRALFATANALTFPVSGTGSAGMEASFVNLVGPGDVAVVGVNGLFGERMCEVAARCGAEVVRVEAPWGRPLDPEAVLAAHPAPAVVAVVHAETSTGVANDVAAIGALLAEAGDARAEACLVVDTVTSLGGMAVSLDAWGADVAYSGTQKCLGAPPGLSPLSVSERARSRLRARPTSWYLDLNLIAGYVEAGSGGRTYHHTAPVSMVNALHGALGAIAGEGIDAVLERHRACGERLQAGLEAHGLELFAERGARLAQLTTVRVPDRLPPGMDEAGVRRALLERYGLEIGGGVGPLAGTVWRIGCMGHAARARNVDLCLAALGDVLGW